MPNKHTGEEGKKKVETCHWPDCKETVPEYGAFRFNDNEFGPKLCYEHWKVTSFLAANL